MTPSLGSDNICINAMIYCPLFPNHSQHNMKCPMKHSNCILLLMYPKTPYGPNFWDLYVSSQISHKLCVHMEQ